MNDLPGAAPQILLAYLIEKHYGGIFDMPTAEIEAALHNNSGEIRMQIYLDARGIQRVEAVVQALTPGAKP